MVGYFEGIGSADAVSPALPNAAAADPPVERASLFKKK
jgi:hypothetical protein